MNEHKEKVLEYAAQECINQIQAAEEIVEGCIMTDRGEQIKEMMKNSAKSTCASEKTADEMHFQEDDDLYAEKERRQQEFKEKCERQKVLTHFPLEPKKN